jgi:phage-related protein
MLKKSSPLKLLGQMEPNLAGSIYVRSSIKILHLVPFGQQTWLLLLKIEHMVKLHVFGNNSKTINNIRNLTKWSAQQDLTTLKFWRKYDYPSRSYCPFFIILYLTWPNQRAMWGIAITWRPSSVC